MNELIQLEAPNGSSKPQQRDVLTRPSRSVAVLVVSVAALAGCAHVDEPLVRRPPTAAESAGAERRAAEEKRQAAEQLAQKRAERAPAVEALEARLATFVKLPIVPNEDFSALVINHDWNIATEARNVPPGTVVTARDSDGSGPVLAWCPAAKEVVYASKSGALLVGSGQSVRAVGASNRSSFLSDYGCKPWEPIATQLKEYERSYDHEKFMALAGDMSFLDDIHVQLQVGSIDAAIPRQREELAGLLRLRALKAAEKRVDDEIDAAFSQPTTQTLLPLASDGSQLLTNRLKVKADADPAKAQALKAEVAKRMERALAKGRSATAAALDVILVRMSDTRLAPATIADLRASKPATTEDRARVAAAIVAAHMLPAAHADGDEAASLLRQLYSGGDLTAELPLSILKIGTGAPDAFAADGATTAVTLKVTAPLTGDVTSKDSKVARDTGTTSHEMGPNPEYTTWLAQLDALDRKIESLGGDAERSFAATRRAHFVELNIASEGSSVRTERSETSDSASRRTTAAIGGLVTTIALHAAQRDRDELVAKEPAQRVSLAARHDETTEYRTQDWEASLRRTLVLSGAGADLKIDQAVTGPLPGQHFVSVYVKGKAKRDVSRKSADVKKEVIASLDADARARIRTAVLADLAARIALLEKTPNKTIPAAERADDDAFMRALFGIPPSKVGP